MKNGIYLVATPIGNIKDITLRALEVLKTADTIACEDTRITKKLFSLLSLSTKDKTFIPVHDHNETEASSVLIDKALHGSVVAYVSDAGSPLISDPGFKLARRCRDSDIYYTTIPGACAAICALQLSGQPTNSFMFAGFIPQKDKARKDFLIKHQSIDSTLIFYETANRLTKTLSAISQIFTNREVSIVREITKLFEECQTGTAADLLSYYTQTPPKGEIVIVIAPPTTPPSIDFIPELQSLLQKSSLKSAVSTIVSKYNLNKNEVYQKALELKQ